MLESLNQLEYRTLILSEFLVKILMNLNKNYEIFFADKLREFAQQQEFSQL